VGGAGAGGGGDAAQPGSGDWFVCWRRTVLLLNG